MMSTLAHPPCPTCGTNIDVVQLVRVVEDEQRWLDANGDVRDACDGKYREDTGWGWHCRTCNTEWELRGSLAVETDRTRPLIDPNLHAIPHDDWDRILGEIIGDLSAASLMQVPGMYEVLSEHFGPAITEQWQEEQGIDTHADACGL